MNNKNKIDFKALKKEIKEHKKGFSNIVLKKTKENVRDTEV